MTWTAPRTWVTDEVVTSSLLNTHLRDNELALYHPLALDTADRDVANTPSELSLWSTTAGGVTVPANALGVNGVVVMRLEGDWLHNNVDTDAVTIRVKWGGTTVLAHSTSNNGQLSANGMVWEFLVRVHNRGATNAQWVSLLARSSAPQSPTTGSGGIDSQGRLGGALGNTAAVDTTVAQTLDVTAQWSVASGGNSFRKRWGQTLLGQN